LRIRPLVAKETREGCQAALELVPNEPQVLIGNTNKCFTYDFAYDGETEQAVVYQEAVRPIIEKLFIGFNITVLAYGQTGSGKTHTMGTAYRSNCDPETEGVIPRAVKDIFNYIKENSSQQYLVKVSFLELYNEQLFDLLSEKDRVDTIVDIREDTKGIKIPGLTEMPVSTLKETMVMLEKASDGRVTAATAMNMTSSRSHAIFTLTVEAAGGANGLTVSKFHLVDLAGSERQKKTKAKGDRLKEGININMGLLALGNVISALGDEHKSANHHIPYRDSKLTRLLQDSLGGNSHTLMIACCSPADSNVEETISTLRYADRARKIKNKPVVNKDAKSAEMSRLRGLVQQLQLQLLQAGGVHNAAVSGDELNMLRERLEMVESENNKLTSALQEAMEDNAHMSEKVLLSEQAQESLRARLNELSSETEEALKGMDNVPEEKKDVFNKLREKVESVVDHQKKAEKTMMEHDISRFNPPSRDVSLNDSDCGGEEKGEDKDQDEGDKTQDLGGAQHALRQTELASKLQDLNKVLLAKQELAEKMGANDEKMLSMKLKYEEALKHMEEEIGKLQFEKDNLMQQQRNAGSGVASLTTSGPNNKVSEQRRKRIQELETQIQSLKKQQTEKMKLSKLNAQNEAKVKKLGEEITSMKAAKVKLIKTMREESDKVRQWKLSKEKEVNQLKQKDRRAQVNMAKMERLHERQKNVMRRKMEETVAVNKRLKDSLEKKKNVRAMRGENDKTLIGSGDRVRGWVSSELDVVVSVKEALKSKEQLIKDRKEMNLELQKMKQATRRTMTQEERKESGEKITELQSSLDLRNAQISELQQQILSFNEDKEKDKGADRWSRLTSMVEAKLAAQYLFDTAAEMTASVCLRSSEIRELKSQLEDISSIKDNLQVQINNLKLRHEDEVCNLEREHEEKVLFLLRQLTGPKDEAGTDSPDVSLGKDISSVEKQLQFQSAEIAKMSTIHDQLMDRERELADLREELKGGRRHSLMPAVSAYTPPSKNNKKRVTIAVERYKEDELDELWSEEDESSEDEDSDDEWRKTPMFKRIRKERQSLAVPEKRKRRSSAFLEEDEKPEINEDSSSKKKRGSASGGCTCKGGCQNKRCSCKKAGPFCSALCKCPANKCANREVPGDDVSDASCMSTDMEASDLEVDDSSANTTDKLLDATFELPKITFATPHRSPLKQIRENRDSADMFAYADSDVEATPTNKPVLQASYFTSPQLQ